MHKHRFQDDPRCSIRFLPEHQKWHVKIKLEKSELTFVITTLYMPDGFTPRYVDFDIDQMQKTGDVDKITIGNFIRSYKFSIGYNEPENDANGHVCIANLYFKEDRAGVVWEALALREV